MGTNTKTANFNKLLPSHSTSTKNTASTVAQSHITERGELAKAVQQSQKRCLKAAGLTDERLELLATLDFKPLVSGQNKTLAGSMFDLRVTESIADLESVSQALENLQSSNPDGYTNALNTYQSVLVGTEADVALLKILLLLEKYATHTARFEPFISEYEAPEGLDASFFGDTNLDILSEISGVDLTTMNGKATQLLLQVCSALNCATFGISPHALTDEQRSENSPRVISKFNASDSSFTELLYNIAYISRDLTFSREVTRIRDDVEPDEEFKEMFIEAFGESFVTSAREVKNVIMPNITGMTNFSSLLKQGLSSQTYVTGTSVDSQLTAKKGIASTLKVETDVLLPEASEVTYNRKYDPVNDIVNDAFFGAKPLDFTNFSGVVDQMTKQITDSVLLGKTCFRISDAAAGTDGSAIGPPIASAEQPLSMGAVSAVILETFERRFSSKVRNSLTTKFYDWLTPEHVNYTKVLAWMLIRDKPDIAKKLVHALFDDYEAGHLTALGVPAPIEGTAEIDEETGEEITGTEEISPVINVKPGTENRVSLSGVNTRLNGRIYLINKYYEDEVHQAQPQNILSRFSNDEVSYPPIKTNRSLRGADLYDYFGRHSYNDADPDLRLINVIFGTKRIENDAEPSKNTSHNQYLSSKIIAAEIVDSVLDVLRQFVSAFVDVEAVEDGDPVFPFITQFKGPYGGDNTIWGYTDSGYESFSFNQWVPTLAAAEQLFTRSTDKVTYFRRVKLEKTCEKIIDVFASLMEAYNFLQPRKEVLTGNEVVVAGGAHWTRYFSPVCATVKYIPTTGITPYQYAGASIDTDNRISSFIDALSDINSELLEATYADFDSSVTTIQNGLPRITATRGSVIVPRGVLVGVLSSRAALLKNSKREDDILAFLYDFLQKYADRVDGYKTATLDIAEGDGAPLGGLIANLRETGDAGEDVLQNMTVNQMALKHVALHEEKADEEKAYLPRRSILNDSERNSVHVLCGEHILASPEGDTTKVVLVGLPAGIFDKNGIDSEFCLKVSYTDIEYPQLVFRSKSYKFDKDLYILPDDIENAGIRKNNDFNDVIDKIRYTKIRVEVVESEDTTASISLFDDDQKLQVDEDNREIYTNLAVSEVLKLYYQVMLGTNFSESAFQSTPEGVNIPVSESTARLAQSMADQISAVANYSGELAENLKNLVSDITTFENIDDFVDGEIAPVDVALLGDLKNAYQSRVLSSDVMRSRVISAKMFDRVFAIPVDPDEFYIVPPGESQIGDVSTPQEVFDFYLNGGIIEDTGRSAPFTYKLAPRKSAEGSMALGSLTITLSSVDNDSNTEEMLEL